MRATRTALLALLPQAEAGSASYGLGPVSKTACLRGHHSKGDTLKGRVGPSLAFVPFQALSAWSSPGVLGQLSVLSSHVELSMGTDAKMQIRKGELGAEAPLRPQLQIPNNLRVKNEQNRALIPTLHLSLCDSFPA